jgi:hypothetical protein
MTPGRSEGGNKKDQKGFNYINLPIKNLDFEVKKLFHEWQHIPFSPRIPCTENKFPI